MKKKKQLFSSQRLKKKIAEIVRKQPYYSLRTCAEKLKSRRENKTQKRSETQQEMETEMRKKKEEL